MIRPVRLKTPKQVYDRVYRREIAIERLPEDEVKEKVRIDLARLRMRAETLQAQHKSTLRKPAKR
jgi:hypothetical protein